MDVVAASELEHAYEGVRHVQRQVNEAHADIVKLQQKYAEQEQQKSERIIMSPAQGPIDADPDRQPDRSSRKEGFFTSVKKRLTGRTKHSQPNVITEGDRVVAAREGIPILVDSEKILKFTPLSAWITLTFGILLGTSFGLIVHAIYIDNLVRNPVTLVLWSLLGCGIAVATRIGLMYVWIRSAQLGAFRSPWYLRLAWCLFAVTVSCGLIALDSVLVVHGLLSDVIASETINSLGRGAVRHISLLPYYFAAGFASSAYVLYTAGSAYAKAAQDLMLSRVRERRTQNMEITTADIISARHRLQEAHDDLQAAIVHFNYVRHIAFALLGGFIAPYQNTPGIMALHGKQSLLRRWFRR
jgi:hypothetical protein